MKKETFLKKVGEIEKKGGYGIQGLLDKDFSGACPCFYAKFTVEGVENEVWGRCWRVSEDNQG